MAATTTACVPASSVGWMSGAKKGEWFGTPVPGAKPPRPQYVYGVPNASGIRLKSSLAGTRPSGMTRSVPKWARNASVTVLVTSASLSVSGNWS